MFNRKIHDVVGITQEGMHSINVQNILAVMLKIDLVKAYDNANWVYLRLLLV
jgi:hypothetical protein